MTDAQTETAPKAETVDLSYLAKAKTRKATIAPVPRGRRSAPNPVEPHYLESFNALDAEGMGEARSLEVTAGVALRVENLLRKAAMDAKYGVAIQMQLAAVVKNAAEDIVPLAGVKDLEPDTKLWVAFQAKPKQIQNRKPKNETATDADATPAE
jgi:hypothetical protein